MPNDRRIVDACYDTVKEVQLDQQRWQLEVGGAFLIGYVDRWGTTPGFVCTKEDDWGLS